MKRWLINVGTNWCGEHNTYSAYAETELELLDTINELAYQNFSDFSGFTTILEELFPNAEEYTEEMENEAMEIESEYYYGDCEEWDENRPEKEWLWYDLVYDGRNLKPEINEAEELYNELDNISKT